MTGILLVAGSCLAALTIFAGMLFLKFEFKKAAQENFREERQSAGLLSDYGSYAMPLPEKILWTMQAAVCIAVVTYVFYHSLLISFIAVPLALFYPRVKAVKKAAARRHQLSLQFREALYSLGSSVTAGKSVELAFKEVPRDLAVIYTDPETPIIREFVAIAGKLEMNETIENALADLALRSQDEDIRNFAEVFAVGKRSGGNMKEIIRHTAAIISDKLRIKEEIYTLLAERKFEQKVLNIMPIALLLLLSWSTGDYMTPVFTTVLGRVIMTIAIMLLLLAYVISERITNIEV